MFCGNCGNKLEDGAKFCTKCGSPVGNSPMVNSPVINSPMVQMPGPVPPKPAKKINKKWIILGVSVVAILAIVVTSVFLVVNKNNNNGADGYIYAQSGECDKDGNYYVPLGDGKSLNLGQDVNEAYVTPNKKYVVVSSEDSMYVIKVSNNKKMEVTNGDFDIYDVHNDGFVYVDYDDDYDLEKGYRFTFSDQENVYLGNVSYIEIDPYSFTISYIRDDELYLLKESSKEAEKIDTNGYTPGIVRVQNNKVIYYISKSSYKDSIYSYSNGETKSIGDMELSSYSSDNSNYRYYAYVNPLNDCSLIFYDDGYSDVFYIETSDEDVLKVNLNEPLEYVSTREIDDFEKSGCYIWGYDSNDKIRMYYISPKGESSEVNEDIDFGIVTQGTLYYADGNDALKTSKLSKAEALDVTTIDSDEVESINVIDGNVWYETKSSVYFYKDGKEPVYLTNEGLEYVYIAGDYLYYFKNVQDYDYSNEIYIGDLYKYSPSNGKSTLVDEDVICNSFNTDHRSYYYTGNDVNVWYLKKESSQLNWYDYNGKKATLIAENIDYD